MEPITMAMLAAQGVSVVGSLLGGIGAKKEADLNVYNIKTEKIMNQTQAMQQANLRQQEYDLATSANIATFAAMGRDIGQDRSVEAFLNRQREIAGQDVARIGTQVQAENIASDMRALAEKRRGRNTLYSSLFNAAGTVGEGLYRYDQVK